MNNPELLTLRLEPGLDSGRAHIDPAPDIPLDPLVVEVPLFAGAIATTTVQENASIQYPATEYLKTATAAFEVPADAETAAEWYEEAFEASGYMRRASIDREPQEVNASFGMWFESIANSKLRAALSFQAVAPHRTHVVYLVTAITPPPRPASSHLPPEIKESVVEYKPWNRNPSESRRRFVITDPAPIRDLVAAINALTDIAPGTVFGARDRGQGAWLTFVLHDGSEVLVTVKPSHHLVFIGDSRALTDTKGVWKEVSRIAGFSPDMSTEY